MAGDGTTLSFMASRLYAFSGLTFVSACVLFAFVSNVDRANETCIIKWIDQVRKLSKTVTRFVNTLHMPFNTRQHASGAKGEVTEYSGEDSDDAEEFNFFQTWEDDLVSASTTSDCVAAVGIIYAFLLFFNAVFNFATLCLSANWQMSRVIRYQLHVNVFGGVLALTCVILFSVYCHYIDLNLLVLEGFQLQYASDPASVRCLGLLSILQSKWCPTMILLAVLLFATHCYIAKITRSFEDSLTSSIVKSGSNSSSQSGSPARSKATKAAQKAQEDRKFSLLNVKNLVVGGAARGAGGGGGASSDRTRLPSSRNYPSSPILPVAHDDFEKGEEPLTHVPSAPLFQN